MLRNSKTNKEAYYNITIPIIVILNAAGLAIFSIELASIAAFYLLEVEPTFLFYYADPKNPWVILFGVPIGLLLGIYIFSANIIGYLYERKCHKHNQHWEKIDNE